MPSTKKTLVLDLGMQSLRLAEFEATSNGGLKLLRGARREFLLDPALDASRPDQTRLALSEILKSWKIKSGKVACILPAHTVFTRVVPLDIPGGISGKVDAVARFEAQQNIPFPIEEVVWDYVVMGELPSGAVNVVFLAVKTDLLEPLCEAVMDTGLDISLVTVSSLALYDAFRITGLPDDSEPTLLLDAGSRTTNMIVASEESFFCRSIPSGGLAVTTAISKDIHATMEEAEQLKLTRGSVGLGPGFEAPSDPVEANLARVARQTLIKTQTDISRSLSYYRSNLGGHDPTRILLTGGMAAMPYFSEFIQEKFQKETSFFNPIDGVSITADASTFVEANPNNLGELVGGALGVLWKKHTAVRLLPASVARKQDFLKRLPSLIAAAALFVATLGCWWFYAQGASQALLQEAEKITQETRGKEQTAKKIDTLLQQQEEIRKASSEILSVILLREAYPRILSELASKVPERFLWITEIQPVIDTASKSKILSPNAVAVEGTVAAVDVKGLYLDNPRQAAVIDDFVTSLQSSDLFLVEEKEKSKIITQRGSTSGEYWAYPFSLRIPLRQPITQLP